MEVLSLGSKMYLLQGTFPCLLCSAFLMFFIYYDNSMTRTTQKLFMLATVCVVLLSTSECIEHYFQHQGIYHSLCLILSALSYTFRIAAAGFTAAITQRTASLHKKLIISGIALNAVIAFISIPTGCIFSLTEDFIWTRGVLHFLPYTFIAWYSTVLLISSFLNFKTNKKEAFLIISGSLLCILGNMLEIFMHWKFILSFAFLTYICFYFLCLNVQLYRRDAMTNLLNRRSFFLDINRNAAHTFAVISIDLNNLKFFNDTEGHSSGDNALCTVANCMKSVFRRYGFCYRTGGDEFMVTVNEKYLSNLEKYIEAFHQKLSKTKYSASTGYAIYKPGDNIDSVLEKADMEMYKNKRNMKEKDKNRK